MKIFAFCICIFLINNLSILSEIPDNVQAGNSFLVKIIIDNNDIENFVQFQQELPDGFTAKKVNLKNGIFSFKNQKVTVKWIKFPKNRKIIFSYKVSVKNFIEGDFKLSGIISYINNNQREVVKLQNHKIKISKKKNIKELVKNNEIKCFRQKPYMDLQGNYIINLFVNKKNNKKHARIAENIPLGFDVEEINIEGASFNFIKKDRVARFLWLNLPIKKKYIVSYKLIPQKNNDKIPKIKGVLSYVTNNDIIYFDIIEKSKNLKNAKLHKKKNENLENKSSIIYNKDKYINLRDVEEGNEINEINSHKNFNKKNNIKIYQKDIPKLEYKKGLVYRIQVAAALKNIDLKYFRKMKIEDFIKMEYNKGWKKYLVGEFVNYKNASSHVDFLKKEIKLKNIFIVSYYDGKRINLKKAMEKEKNIY